MTYYINPWVFYFLGIIDALRATLMGFVIIIAVAAVCHGLLIFIEWDGDTDTSTIGKSKDYFKKLFIPLIVAVVLLTFLPSKETCYQMLIASQVTVENVDSAKETIKDIVDYIVEASEKISGGNEHDG